MKTLLIPALLLCLSTFVYAQQDTIYDGDNYYEYLFDNINTNQLQRGFLLDKAFTFIDIKRFDGHLHNITKQYFIKHKPN